MPFRDHIRFQSLLLSLSHFCSNIVISVLCKVFAMQSKARQSQRKTKWTWIQRKANGWELSFDWTIPNWSYEEVKKKTKKNSQHWNTKTDRNDKVIFYLCVCVAICAKFICSTYTMHWRRVKWWLDSAREWVNECRGRECPLATVSCNKPNKMYNRKMPFYKSKNVLTCSWNVGHIS